jgi:hypothetical protein
MNITFYLFNYLYVFILINTIFLHDFRFLLFRLQPHRWCIGQCARLECDRSWMQVKPHTITGICCFSAKHAALVRKSKDWLALNQNNVYPRTVVSVSWHYKYPTMKMGK